jgi:hypothetical protein
MSDYSELKRLAEEVNSAFPNKEDLWNMVCTPTVALDLIRDLESMQADAERYRWLRNPDRCIEDFLDGPADNIVVGSCGGEDVLWLDDLDAAIDSAISSPENP